MVNPISSTSTNSAAEASNPAPRQPQPQSQAPTTAANPQDTVTLKSAGDKSAGDPDHDGK